MTRILSLISEIGATMKKPNVRCVQLRFHIIDPENPLQLPKQLASFVDVGDVICHRFYCDGVVDGECSKAVSRL